MSNLLNFKPIQAPSIWRGFVRCDNLSYQTLFIFYLCGYDKRTDSGISNFLIQTIILVVVWCFFSLLEPKNVLVYELNFSISG